ncbi:putative ORFan [Tupanvirus deep ocean]|uniref:ORFan n=2 Tax=Tupanvirus TaxID=2094720 RepID=A0AC62A9L7_9VIRU|nr:putative ORFan [Tupanvirus deep ocean]QKU34466.1 putative ORFan [Tupanvirus deep ocean]
MIEPFYLDERNYENIVHSYKSVLPKSVTNEEIIYDFPDIDCMLDNFCLVVKFDGDIIPKNNLTLEDFVSMVEPYYTNNDDNFTNIQPSCSTDPLGLSQGLTYHTNPIPSDFAAAYTDICKLNKNKLCFTIPLLRMVAILTEKSREYWETWRKRDFIKKPHIKLIRQQKYCIDPTSIFQEMKDVNLENMPDEIMSSITNYAESKIQFELFYRETLFFNGINKKVTPELIDTYTLDSYEIKFDNTNNGSIVVVDGTTQYNYKNMLVILNLDSNDTINPETSNEQSNYLDEIVIKTRFSSKFNPKNTIFKDFLREGSFRLTKELAEIFNINYQVGTRYYLIDISKFITAYIQSITRSGGMYDHICLQGKLVFDEMMMPKDPQQDIIDHNTIDHNITDHNITDHNNTDHNITDHNNITTININPKSIDQCDTTMKFKKICKSSQCNLMDPNNNIKDLVGDIDMLVDIVGIALDLQLTLKKSDSGVAKIYFF